MTFNILLVIAVLVFIFGVLVRIYPWFSQGLGPAGQFPSPVRRVAAAIKAVLSTLFGPGLVPAARSLVTDLLLQQRIFVKDRMRWLAHGLIFFGFVPLLIFHALGWFSSEPTLNPWMFLRNFFGVMVLAGVCLALYRRVRLRNLRLKSGMADWLALGLVGLIVLSGFSLEAVKISGYSVFERMIAEYGDLEGEEDLLALEAYWVKENGLISPNIKDPSAEQVALGNELNENSCTACHSGTGSAFISFSLAKFFGPVAALLGNGWIIATLKAVHLLACFGFLAWLPFSKMFHILAAPLSLMIRRVKDLDEVHDPANLPTRQMIGLSACTHCGSCSVECSSLMFYETLGNDFILPSEKMQYLKKVAAGVTLDAATRDRLQKGLYICTSCDRCSTVCPSGINLREIFIGARYALLETGRPETSLLSHFSFPLSLAKHYAGSHLKALQAVENAFKKTFKTLTDMVTPLSLAQGKEVGNETYRSCYTCQRCTNVCPVVRSYEQPVEALGLLPHQIIYSLGIGQTDLALGAQMIWSCSTCYLCQEHCPNKVELTDIFYALKNRALMTIESGESR
jgi:heterodisulfide reductase subunit C/nitrate reductase gamma subunit